jgi:hypothetical protein
MTTEEECSELIASEAERIFALGQVPFGAPCQVFGLDAPTEVRRCAAGNRGSNRAVPLEDRTGEQRRPRGSGGRCRSHSDKIFVQPRISGTLSAKGKHELQARGFTVVEQVSGRIDIVD